MLLLCIFGLNGNTQCLAKQDILDSISLIDGDTILTSTKKLERLYTLKNTIDKCNIKSDSVYSNLFLKIGYYEIHANQNFTIGINFINASLRINMSGKSGSSKYFAIRAFYILAVNYYNLSLFDKALKYFDSTILIGNTFPDTTKYILRSKLYKAYLFFQSGDYQKAVDESTSGIEYSLKKNDSLSYLNLLTQRAQSLYYQNNIAQSLLDVNKIIDISTTRNYIYGLVSALKIKASIFEKNQNFKIADSLFKKAIDIRIQTKHFEQVANDYNDYGSFYLDSLKDYNNALKYYEKSISFGKKVQDSIALARANVNISEVYLKQKNYKTAFKYYIKALTYLNLFIGNDICKNTAADKLNAIDEKELIMVMMNNKIEMMLGFFENTNDEKYLSSCLQTALITDTLITKMRHSQSANESKLYWRDYTRDFYTNAIEASYLAKRSDLAFYFMEKSRGALLNDKLNELGAAAYLPATESKKQETYQIRIIELEQKLLTLSDASKQYQNTQLELLNAKNDFEQYIKSLETKYPEYYQYKYEDEVPSLKILQQYLAKNNQSFVYYFMDDSVSYALVITSNTTKFIRFSNNQFNKNDLFTFLKLCSNKEALNNNYTSFALLSNSIYKKIFQPLGLPKGRVIICTDNIVIPFDALCTDETGKHFLLNNYSFSYVYSARYLMKHFSNVIAKGNFAGFAPVSFAPYLNVNDLKNAADALNASSVYYHNNKLFTHQNATRNNFFKYASSYSVISIFSHARADTTDNEPVLYMQDSLIHLSELQLLNNPATKLVLLSACQTNVGKTATGEGIYSLARGFAAAGIPSVSATLWKADEETIYKISEKFNQYLSEGMNKDEALQKAKLDFLQNNTNEKLLPYYWANMILIGNTDAIQLTTSHNYNLYWIAAAIIIAGIIIFLLNKPKTKIKVPVKL